MPTKSGSGVFVGILIAYVACSAAAAKSITQPGQPPKQAQVCAHNNAAELTIEHFMGRKTWQYFSHAEMAAIVEKWPDLKEWEMRLICPAAACECVKRLITHQKRS
jgi:hypothetical protein